MKIKRIGKLSRLSTTSLRKRAWRLFSELVRRKEKGVCYSCGEVHPWKQCHAGHYEHKDCMDFVPENIHCQCIGCNTYKGGNRNAYAIHLEADYGYGILQKLKKQADTPHKFKVGELLALIASYKKEISELE